MKPAEEASMMMDNSEASLVQLLLQVQKSSMAKEYSVQQMEQAVNELLIVYIASIYGSGGVTLRELLLNIEKKIVACVMGMTNLNEKEASYLLGVKRSTLCEKLKRFDLRSSRLKKYPHWHLVTKMAGWVSAAPTRAE